MRVEIGLLLVGLLACAMPWITKAGGAQPLRLESSQETNIGGAFTDPALQRWHDDELKVTCYALRTMRGTALSCLYDNPQRGVYGR